MEKVTSKWIISDMQKKMDPAQFGNRKGVSIQHYLVKMFDKILKELDKNSHGEAMAAVLTMIDWKQAFPRQDPTLAIQSFINNGVRPALIPVLMSFFENRRMTVKWRDAMSVIRRLKGGGPQGSTKGVLSYMSQSNNNSDCVPLHERYKYFDDLTVLEFVNLLNIGLCSQNVKLSVPSNLPSHNQFVNRDDLKTQGYLDKISKWTDDNLMELNAKKSKIMLVNNSKKYQFTTSLVMKDQVLEVVDEAKLLGTYITSDLKWNKNTDFLIKEANKRMRLLHAASKFVKDRRILTQLYFTHIRCRLEQSAVLWHSSLTIKNIVDLERVQKAAVRIIIGRGYESYSETLKYLNIETLFDRREKLCLRFAKKSLNVENFKHLFPLYKNEHSMKTRVSSKFEQAKTSSKRYKISTIPHLQRMLNRQAQMQSLEFKMLKVVNCHQLPLPH